MYIHTCHTSHISHRCTDHIQLFEQLWCHGKVAVHEPTLGCGQMTEVVLATRRRANDLVLLVHCHV